MADESGDSSPLGDLEARLRAARAREAEAAGVAPKAGGTAAGLGLGLRIGVELVAGVLVGVLIGWALDRWLGTRPWLMVLFFFLGAAAGIMNAYRVSTGAEREADSGGSGGEDRREE